MAKDSFAEVLRGGDRRSIGEADQVAAAVVTHPQRFNELFQCLSHTDPLVRLRAADALEKISRDHADWFARHRDVLLGWRVDDGTPEVRWHLVLICARLKLSRDEAAALMRRLEKLVREDDSRIVKVMALEAAALVRNAHPQFEEAFVKLRQWAEWSPWPSLQARARKLGEVQER